MPKYVPLLLLLFTGLAPSLYAQERIISGILTDETGSPLPGVNIIVKGTASGTVSDSNGYYSVQATLGATLVFSFIGYTSYEVVVTTQNSHAVGMPAVPAPATKSAIKHLSQPQQELPEKGIARMGEHAPGFVLKSGNRLIQGLPASQVIPQAFKIKYLPPRWAGIRYGKAGQNGMFIVQDRMMPRTPLQVNFTSAFTLDKVYKVPLLQNSYAQGRPVAGKETWQGPETGEVFSWGPKLANLAYDGIAYPYDAQGRLVARGNGNSRPANTYNPYSFFRQGFSIDNQLSLHKRFGEKQLDVGFGQKRQSYIVPGADYIRNNIHMKFSAPVVYNLEAAYSLYYSRAGGNLLPRGANMAAIFSGILRTPPSFDNAHGLSGKQAYTNRETYTLENGAQRSPSPGNTDNPYWLVNTMPDQENIQNVLSSLQLKYSPDYSVSLVYNLGIDKQWHRYETGLAPLSAGSPEGRFTSRQEEQGTIHSILSPTFRTDLGEVSLEASSTYDLSFTSRLLNRKNASGFPDDAFDLSAAKQVIARDVLLHRTTHDLATALTLDYREIVNIKLTNQSYFSSTLQQRKTVLPGAGIGFVFTNIDPLSNSSLLSYGRVYSSYAMAVKEAPLLYSGWQFNSTNLSLNEYLSYAEEAELPTHKALQAEQYRKWESGMTLNLFSHRIAAGLLYFNRLITRAIVPTLTEGLFTLSNSADIRNKGYELSLQYNIYSYHDNRLRWQSKLSFTSFRPVVTKVYGSEQRIPIAGFREVSTNLVAGQPYGIIYGSTYRRDEAGRSVIGPNGFPLADPEPRPIGNPNPDWIAGLDNTLSWKHFVLSFIMDIRKGGNVWNGTQQALNYYGLAHHTQQARNIRNYIFEGVREDGSQNTQPVDFANPANGLEQNRWVQYGLAGVAEEAIEDASWIRLNEVKLACRLDKLLPRAKRLPQLTLSAMGKNMLLLTRYSGVDPATSLFSYDKAVGLDFFNLPATRSYGFALHVKL